MSAAQKSQQLAYLAQNTEIHWDLSVYDVIALGLPNPLHRAKEQEKVRSISETFSVSHLLEKSFRQLSGGEKARLALALIIAQRPNLLLLDEPTNHLDLAMRDALTLALQNYDGAMLIISHDRSLLRAACDEFRLVADGKLQPFDGDLEDYHRYLNASRQATDNTAASPANSGDSRQEQKRREAEQRQRLRPLKQAVEAQEKTIAKLEAALEQHKAALADPVLYEAENKEKLKEILAAQSETQKALEAAEAAWMEAAEALQAAEQVAG